MPLTHKTFKCASSLRAVSGLTLLAAALLAGPAAQAQVYVADQGDNTLKEFSLAGNSLGNFASGLSAPSGIAIGTGGSLFVTNETGGSAGSGSIQQYSAAGALLQTFGDTTLADPEGIAVTNSGTLYVTNEGSGSGGSIQEYSTSGALLNTFGTNSVEPDELALGPNGNVYVGDENGGSGGFVQEYSPAGTLLTTFGSDANGNNGLSNPEGIAVNKAGDVFVSDQGTGVVDEFSPAGVSVGTFGVGLVSPYGLSLDNSGNVFVVDQGGPDVSEFSPAGVLLNTFGGSVLSANATGLAVNPPQSSPVPEASSRVSLALLLALGLGGLAITARRKNAPGV